MKGCAKSRASYEWVGTLADLAQTTVLRSELLSPLIDAVCFVHDKEGRLALLEMGPLGPAADEEPLRGNIEQLERSA
jgi:hypothetical protein